MCVERERELVVVVVMVRTDDLTSVPESQLSLIFRPSRAKSFVMWRLVSTLQLEVWTAEHRMKFKLLPLSGLLVLRFALRLLVVGPEASEMLAMTPVG